MVSAMPTFNFHYIQKYTGFQKDNKIIEFIIIFLLVKLFVGHMLKDILLTNVDNFAHSMCCIHFLCINNQNNCAGTVNCVSKI